jgi:threonine synthase
VSTRSSARETSFSKVLVQGLAPDGGLILPDSCVGFFRPGEFLKLSKLSYQQLCKRVLEKFTLQLTPGELEDCINAAYATFDDARVLPLRQHSASFFTLETWHGPTASFKDLSLQLMPRLLAQTLQKSGERVNGCLVATSGDTGSAALDGFARAGAVPVVVLFPENGVSVVQKLQMTQPRNNAHVIGVRGADFDFCQTLVKKILNQPSLTNGAKVSPPFLHLHVVIVFDLPVDECKQHQSRASASSDCVFSVCVLSAAGRCSKRSRVRHGDSNGKFWQHFGSSSRATNGPSFETSDSGVQRKQCAV